MNIKPIENAQASNSIYTLNVHLLYVIFNVGIYKHTYIRNLYTQNYTYIVAHNLSDTFLHAYNI